MVPTAVILVGKIIFATQNILYVTHSVLVVKGGAIPVWGSRNFITGKIIPMFHTENVFLVTRKIIPVWE